MKHVLIFSMLLGVWTTLWAAAKPAATDPTQEQAAAKASYLNKADQEVQDLSAKVRSLQERSQSSGAKTREDLDRRVQSVNDKLAATRRKLDELHGSSTEAWHTMRGGLDEALAKLKVDYQKAVSFYNKNEQKVIDQKKEIK